MDAIRISESTTSTTIRFMIISLRGAVVIESEHRPSFVWNTDELPARVCRIYNWGLCHGKCLAVRIG